MNKAAIIHLLSENGGAFINAINVLAKEEHLLSDQDKQTAYIKKSEAKNSRLNRKAWTSESKK